MTILNDRITAALSGSLQIPESYYSDYGYIANNHSRVPLIMSAITNVVYGYNTQFWSVSQYFMGVYQAADSYKMGINAYLRGTDV